MRQTNYSLQEILGMLKSGDSMHPRCLLLNEVGVIMGEDKNKEAEAFLRELLESNKKDKPMPEEERFIAFCYLETANQTSLDQETHDKLKEFRKNPDNQEVIAKAGISIREFREKNN